eukprot:CAMPEP_0176389310 /NCGR_PEP_ID=MMETSP0126-20121128/38271_1 /TAXON_ID=141414 ORGANISM="Strombidinopsis acuminatum, Strain SPMC142" /NCGR_SAMPLE_ID=MMETSP0126 /ASSEMBLY_ACC=CAM_ASM_000229 /LENGTH=177 /DNA_ID=CAMNT_0017758041 /DNA_START=48 /DNA_END=581 /DNA_ORIENTATION=-
MDDDVQPIRSRIREIVEGKWVILMMSLVTLFALFGDDFRLWFFTKEADPYFFVCLIVSLFLFMLEILVNSCVVDEFKYSFFFWLDIIATVSLIPDIDWIANASEELIGLRSSNLSADVFPGELAKVSGGSDKLTKIIKSFRLIRLIRIIKLYKYAVKSNTEAEEAKLREQQKMSQNA